MSVLGFELEWLDNISGQLQTLYLKYFLTDGTIEILQSQIGKAFLKRIFYPDLKLGDLFLGNSISIYNRVMTIKSYANAATKQYFSDKELHILCILNGINDLCTIVSVGNKHGFVVGRVLTVANEVRIADSFVPKGSILFELLGSHGVKQYDALVKDLKILAPAVAVTIQKEAVDVIYCIKVIL